MSKYLKPLLWIIAFQFIAAAIGAVTSQNMDWYEDLKKSALTPPDIAFPIVWSVLYVLLALAGYYVWKAYNITGNHRPFILYWIQMFLNWGWSFVFFASQLIFAGFLWIGALNIVMFAFIAVSWNQNRIAAVLVMPTLLWGLFAMYLNYSIWVLN